jgi:hypothetical protein
MPDNELLDSVLLSLADAFEANKGHAVLVSPSSQEEWEPLREFLAGQSAEGLMRYGGKESWSCALTPKGYATYRPRIEALRALGRSKTA